jgi:hypothetical protein
MKSKITEISKIKMGKAGDGDDPWNGMILEVTGSPGLQGSRVILIRTDSGFEDKGLPNATLANSYSAHIGNKKKDTDFVLKLPNLTGVTDSGDISDRIAEAQKMFRQEHQLRQRLLPEPGILPKLLSKKDASFTLKYKQFEGPAFYVARQFAEGRNLRRWARETYPSSDGKFHGIAKAEDWFRIAEVLLHSLADLHRERAALGFLCPDTIIVPDNIVKGTVQGQLTFHPGAKFHFIDAAESQPVVFLPEQELCLNEVWKQGLLKVLPIRRSYDVMENLYRYRSESPSKKWVKFALDQGSDYYSATDIFSLGVTLAFLATGEDEIISPFEYVTRLICGHKGWQVVSGSQIRRRYHVMKAMLLDDLREAAEKRAGGGKLDARSTYVDSLCRAEVILQCVRSRPDRRAQDTRHVLTSLETFGRMVTSEANESKPVVEEVPPVEALQIKEVLNGLRKIALNDRGTAAMDEGLELFLGPKMPTQVRDLVRHRLYSVLNRIGSLAPADAKDTEHTVRSSLRIGGGSRATLVDALLGALSSIGRKQECLALTNAGIWADGNFGPISRISSMVQLLRLRGVRFQWVIVVKPIELYRPEVQRILGFRRADELRIEQIATKERNQQRKPGKETEVNQENRKEQQRNMSMQRGATLPPLQCWTDDIGYFYTCVDDEEYEEIFRTKKSFIGLRGKSKKMQDPDQQGKNDLRPMELMIAPDLSAREGSLAALTFWVDPLRSKDLLDTFYTYKEKARSVAHFDRIL